MDASMEELRAQVAEHRAKRDAAAERAEVEAARNVLHLGEVGRYQSGEWEFVGWKGGAEPRKLQR